MVDRMLIHILTPFVDLRWGTFKPPPTRFQKVAEQTDGGTACDEKQRSRGCFASLPFFFDIIFFFDSKFTILIVLVGDQFLQFLMNCD